MQPIPFQSGRFDLGYAWLQSASDFFQSDATEIELTSKVYCIFVIFDFPLFYGNGDLAFDVARKPGRDAAGILVLMPAGSCLEFLDDLTLPFGKNHPVHNVQGQFSFPLENGVFKCAKADC